MAKRKRTNGGDAKEGVQVKAKKEDERTEEDSGDRAVWSKSKKKRMRRLQAKQNLNNGQQPKQGQRRSDRADGSEDDKSDESGDESRKSDLKKETEKPETPKNGKNKTSALLEAFKARLSGSRFRTLNEELYTMSSQDSFQRFSESPELFQEYHSGYRHQVNSWPVNPMHVIVEKLKAQAASSSTEKIVVADFGCGEAQLAQDLLKVQQPGRPENKKKRRKGTNGENVKQEGEHQLVCPFKVHSFDLVQPQEEEKRDLVTPCDMANVPLPNSSVDAGVFCLSLMGTNLADFVREAHRVVKPDGCIWIAEVKSRFSEDSAKTQSPKHRQPISNENPSKANNNSIQEFLAVLEDLGFRCTQKDLSNKMFFLLRLEKTGKKPKGDLNYTAKACIYKRR